MEVGSPKRLSLDTNVLFDLADEKDFAHDFREIYQRRNYALVICPTVVAELYFLREHGDTEEQRLASLALRRLASWDIHVFPLTSVQLAIAWRFAATILASGLLPPTEINDARILGETAIAAFPLVVSSDRHLLDIDQDVLRDTFAEADLPPVFPVSPRRLLRALIRE
jgi:predicted nucleic acid-binding protein